jgi:hypothetical protein
MTLESRIEARAVKEMAKVGALAIKVGYDGWPDRLVIYAPGHVIWMEFKQPGTGRISQKQKLRAKELNQYGHEVYYPTSYKEALAFVASARRALANAERRNKRDAEKKAMRALVEAGKRKDGDHADGGG